MRKNAVLMTVLTVSLVFALMLGAASDGPVADTDELITALVLDEAEATALGLEFERMTGTGMYVTATYLDDSPAEYTIRFTVTLSPCKDEYDAHNITVESMSYGCDKCVYPDCKQYECPGGEYVPRRPCYRRYRNGYTDFGPVSGETVFAHGDLQVKIESSAPYSYVVPEHYQLIKSRHEWFVEQVVAKVTAGYLADMMQLTAYAYVATQPTGEGVVYSGQDVVILEGTVMGPNGGVDHAIVEGFTRSPSGSGWNYATYTDSSGNFKRIAGPAEEVGSITAKVRHTDTSPAYAGTWKITIDDFSGQPAETDTGMSLTVSTDKNTYSPEETVIIRGSVWDAKGGLDGATVVVDVDGTKLTATAYSTEKYVGKYECKFPLPPDISPGTYTVRATASYSEYPSVSERTSFIVGEMGITVKTADVIPIPGEMPLPIKAVLDKGKPMKGRIVDVQVVDENGKRISWVSVEQDPRRGSILDENGEIEPILKVREPEGLERPTYLRDWPLKATIKIRISDKGAKKALIEKNVELPFNLALIHGVVVDNKDLKPVTQHFVPDVLGIPELMVFDKEKNLEGDFWVMVRPHQPDSGRSIQELIDLGNDFALKWEVGDNIPLVYSIEESPPMPGEVLELGKVGKTPLEKIKEWYIEFGTTPHTWTDGTKENKPLTGPKSSGVANNLICIANRYKYIKGFYADFRSCQFNCVAMQYKTLWFLNNLKNKKADDENAKFLSKLKGWDYSAVSANWFTPGKWPWSDERTTEHNAVALWDRGKRLWKGIEIPPAGTEVIILDPHGKQKPHWYSGDTVLFSWTIDKSYERMYEGNGWKPPWHPTIVIKGPETGASFAVACPVDVLIVNSQGQRLGILPNGDKVAEFEPIDSYFWQDEESDKQWFFALPEDIYDVKLIGTGSGNFHLLTSTLDGEIHDYGENPISEGEQAALHMKAEGDELTLADGSKPMFEVIPLESERLALPFPAHLLLFATGGVAGLGFLIFLLVTRRKPGPVAPPVTQPARPVRPRGRPEELVSRRPPARPEGPPERLGGGKPSGPPETLD